MADGAELSYQTNALAVEMANAIFGSGATVKGGRYTVPYGSSAIYANGGLSTGVVPSTICVILSAGDALDFTQSNSYAKRSSGSSTNISGANDDAQFNAIAGTNTHETAWLDVDFTLVGDTMTLSLVFSSEDYREYISSQFKAVVRARVNGTHVPFTVGNGVTSINIISGNTQQNLFVNNTNDALKTKMDGLTIDVGLTVPVNICVLNYIRIGVADTSDSSYDSILSIGGGSIQTKLVAMDDSVRLNPMGTKTIDVPAKDIAPSVATLTIAHINGSVASAGSTIVLPSGQVITRNADGTFGIVGDGKIETKNFTHSVSDGFADFLFGECEVLITANDLLNDQSIRHLPGGKVKYVHPLFDLHRVVFAEGLATESFETDVLAEICAMFPEIAPTTDLGHSPAAWRIAHPFEAQLLLTSRKAA